MKMQTAAECESDGMLKGLNSPRFLRVAGFAVGAVIIGAVAVVATASAAGMVLGFRPTAAAQANDASLSAAEARVSSAACGEFMNHFAAEIGKSQAEINAAFQKAIAATLADEVKAGHLTQSQADTLKRKLANQTPCTIGKLKPRGARLAAFMEQYLSAAASVLGISESELKADLKSGQSISQVAATKKITEADFRSGLIARLRPVLDKAVADKKITPAQEQAILDHLKTGPLPLWERPMKHRPGPSPTPSAA